MVDIRLKTRDIRPKTKEKSEIPLRHLSFVVRHSDFVILSLVSCLLSLVSCLLFAQDVYLKLTTGERKRVKIALSFHSDVGAEYIQPLQDMAQEMQEIVKGDLAFSLYFSEIIDTIPLTSKIDLKSLAAQEFSALVKAEISLKKEDTLANVELYDGLFKHKISSEKYKVVATLLRAVCHLISDDIIRTLTGEKGVCQTKIAFSLKKGADKELGVVDYDGYEFRQLTKGAGLHLTPRWIPNTNSITYISYQKEDIWLYRLDPAVGGALSVLSKEKGVNIGAAWSPDGKELALTLTKDGNPEIYIKRGEKLHRLTINECIDASPTWSPNGREIAFVSERSGSPQIYIMSKDGTNVRRLTFSGNYNTSPSWSPKGDRIAYVAREVDGTFQIHTILVNGEGDAILTWQGNNEDPSWAPDGLHMCFVSNRNGKSDLFTMHWDGSCQTRIGAFGDGCYTPNWSTH